MGRSGTSALTRVMSLCGAALPAGMVGASRHNPRGFWEPRNTLHLNATILRRHGSPGFDPSLRLLEEGAFSAGDRAGYIRKIRALLDRLPHAPVVVIKDPQITVLSDMWFEAARLAGLDATAVIAVRHPHEVIASQAATGPTSPELTSALWLKYNLLAERQTRDLPRVFVEYTNLLEDWRREMSRISAALSIDLNNPDEGAIAEFLTPDFRRQRHSGAVTDRFGTAWMSTVYEALGRAARDEPWDQARLDGIFEAYRACEHDFRTAFDNCNAYSNQVLFRPSIKKLAMEAAALAHRRSGTWA
ncbi:sulfotransferase family protein [Mycobacterium sp. 94-17]|uniref:sulfotransferase family protein n=1 Tax=Mycobacterium sp. 94-17 TaxID=2986147 RepID=UPI002D1F1FC2|nr:sulfotransferase family protein [Mycobacterium sp. 94-17]MEB4212250.1 sulfotransferase family protein [Mycobacterium sp. 94-17]